MSRESRWIKDRFRIVILVLYILSTLLCCNGHYYYNAPPPAPCAYGRRCSYDPAPPGRTPPCALPGYTYCVNTDPYPENLIRSLVDTGQFDVESLLSDETKEDFSFSKDPYGYGPNSLINVDQISIVNEDQGSNMFLYNSYGQEIYNGKTPIHPPLQNDPPPFKVTPSQLNNTRNDVHYQVLPNGYMIHNFKMDQSRNDEDLTRQRGSEYDLNGDTTKWQKSDGITQFNPQEWWKYVNPSRLDTNVVMDRNVPPGIVWDTKRHFRTKRNAELVRAARQRRLSATEALNIALGIASLETSADRSRRQADDSIELCPVRTMYVTPRTALNNKGNWKYIVNMPENMTQLVKAELCVASDCNGICAVPTGYTARCKQKYLQKRLVALESSGQKLYTDLFWIPSCCQCSIERN